MFMVEVEMTDKEQQIRIEILPQLSSFATHLWDTGSPTLGRKLDKIAFELLDILDKEND
jgi:hypothetical protein